MPEKMFHSEYTDIYVEFGSNGILSLKKSFDQSKKNACISYIHSSNHRIYSDFFSMLTEL